MESLDLKTLRQANTARSKEWCGDPTQCLQHRATEEFLFRSNELGGETGEAQNFVKKVVRQINGMKGGIPLQDGRDGLADELADVVICADRLAEAFDIDLGAAIVAKFNKTSEEHGFKARL